MSRIGTDFLDQQADLFMQIGRRDLPSREELESGDKGFSVGPFVIHHVRETGARRVLSIGAGTGMLELAIAGIFPHIRFTLVEPSAVQLAHFEKILGETQVDRGRFELFRGYFRDYVADGFDLIISLDAWYYAHSAEELQRVMSSLQPRGRLLVQMWADGSLIWRLCTEIGAAGKSRLGHLLSAEEVRDCAEELGYSVSVDSFDYRDCLKPSDRVARAEFIRQSFQSYRRAACAGRDAESAFWNELGTTDRGRAWLNALAYFKGVPPSAMDDAEKAEAWGWLERHSECHQRCTRLVIRHP